MIEVATDLAAKRLVENLQSDFRLLSNEAKKKHTAIKEAAETGLVKIRNLSIKNDSSVIEAITGVCTEILHPLLMGCDSKNPRLVQISLSALQKLIAHQALDANGASVIVNELWNLIEFGVEDLKVLQTVALMLTTTTTLVRGPLLAKCVYVNILRAGGVNLLTTELISTCLVLCFRLYFSKRDASITNTSSATVRQLVTLVFDRAVAEAATKQTPPAIASGELVAGTKSAPKSLGPYGEDAFMLYQDLCRLVNGDSPIWLSGMSEMSRVLGLELLESIVTLHSSLFEHPEFCFLLKELLCPLIIKLFSPSVKFLHVNPSAAIQHGPATVERPSFPLTTRLLRLICVLITKMINLLVTECEIFLSLIMKFLNFDRLHWQQALSLEIIHKITVQPDLLKRFCVNYDMRVHATKVLQDIVSTLAGFMHSSFLRQLSSDVTKQQQSDSDPGTPVQAQAGFMYRGTWMAATTCVPNGTAKPIYLEMLDRNEPPTVVDGYCYSVAYLSLLDLAGSLQRIISPLNISEANAQEIAVAKQLLASTQTSLLAAISLLLEASIDESTTDTLLNCLQTQVVLGGRVGDRAARDACLALFCKVSLPPSYSIGGSTPVLQKQAGAYVLPTQEDFHGTFLGGGGGPGVPTPSQVVAVGTPCPVLSLQPGSMNAPVMLTAKNVQCMRSLLALATANGTMLDTAWHQVLSTLQHLVWILGLRPAVGGGLKASAVLESGGVAGAASSAQIITTAVTADLPVLSNMLTKLLEATVNLDEVGLHHVLDALCKLSSESLEVATAFNREPSLFGISKLLELGLVNMNRLFVYWKPLSTHLLEVCSHSLQKLREWGSSALTTLVMSAFAWEFRPEQSDKVKLQVALLTPIVALNSFAFEDVRQRQVDCVLHLLQNRSGQLTAQAWPMVIDALGSIVMGNEKFGETLVRSSFQGAQLIVSDFLPTISSICLQQIIEVVAKFGAQSADLNASLASVGLLMNISDYLYHNSEKLAKEPPIRSVTKSKAYAATVVDDLWLFLYTCLSDLCVDQRSPVRKSASQTLFNTIGAHGGLLGADTWTLMVWQVLFPLLDRVKVLAHNASTARVDSAANILIHHSRDTESKQWAETRCLTLDGVVKVFGIKRAVLCSLQDFTKAWSLLLSFIDTSGRSANTEISISALKSFKELLNANFVPSRERSATATTIKSPSLPTQPTLDFGGGPTLGAEHWLASWKMWLGISSAIRAQDQPIPTTGSSVTPAAEPTQFVPNAAYLIAFLDVFPILFDQTRRHLEVGDIRQLSNTLRQLAQLPPAADMAGVGVYLMPTNASTELSPAQQRIMDAVAVVYKECLSIGNSKLRPALPAVFDLLLCFVSYGCYGPNDGQKQLTARQTTASAGGTKTTCADWVTASYVPFAENALKTTLDLYQHSYQQPEVVQSLVLFNIIKTLRISLTIKYKCPSQSTWKQALLALMSVLRLGLPVARQNEQLYQPLWIELALVFEDFLFNSGPIPETLSFEEVQAHEFLDCKIIDLIRTEILPHAASSPVDFLHRIIELLNRGTFCSVSEDRDVFALKSTHRLREELARACFDTLLTFSYGQPDVVSSASAGGHQPLIGAAAVETLLQKCRDVANAFVADSRTTSPMPRNRILEMVSVLKAIATLIRNLRSAPRIEARLWTYVFELHFVIVGCVPCHHCEGIVEPLMDALREYGTLLKAPSASSL